MRKHSGLTLLAVALWAMPAFAQDIKETLRTLPDESVGVWVTQRLEQIDGKLQLVVKKMGLPLPISPLELGKAAIGATQGVNAKGCAAVAFVPPGAGEQPVPVFYIPVSDYGAFVKQFQGKDTGIVDINLADGRKVSVAKNGSFAVMVDADQRDVLKIVLSSKANLVNWGEPIQAWLEENDATLLATPRGFKLGLTSARQLLAKAKEGAAAKEDGQEFVRGIFTTLDGFLKSVESDVTHAGLGARIDKGGNVIIDTRAVFAKGGTLGKNAANVNAGSGGPLTGLPAGPYAFAFGGAIPPALMEGMLKINLEIMKLTVKDGLDAQTKDRLKKLEQSFAQMSRGIQGMAFVFRAGKEGDSLFGRTSGVVRLDNAAAYMEAYEKMMPEMNALYKDLKLPFLPEISLKKTMIGKTVVLESETTMPVVGDDPMQKKIMEAMFGPGGKMKTSVAAANANTIVMTYTAADGLKDILQGFGNKGLKDDENVTRTTTMLPAGSQWVMLVDPRGTTEVARQWVKSFLPDVPVPIPELPQTPPVGIGAKLSATGFNIQVVVPVQILESIGRMVGGQP